MDNQARKQLGNNIKQLRTSLGLSQEQLAEKASLHRTYVGAVERGERNVSLDNIIAISRALGVSASTLLKDVE
ncbi:MAG: helix-turn-helix transcriptional regulator [Crocosphaera sp.]|nr:helix-turn-helix transcriptional regulator [Crocosphaera sp.]